MTGDDGHRAKRMYNIIGQNQEEQRKEEMVQMYDICTISSLRSNFTSSEDNKITVFEHESTKLNGA